MSIQISRYRTAAAAAVGALLFLVASPASAKTIPVPVEQPASVWTCPTRVDAVAQVLRAEGFSAQAARNYAVLTRRDCGS